MNNVKTAWTGPPIIVGESAYSDNLSPDADPISTNCAVYSVSKLPPIKFDWKKNNATKMQ